MSKRLMALLTVAMLLLMACSGASEGGGSVGEAAQDPDETTRSASAEAGEKDTEAAGQPQRGGTLRIAMPEPFTGFEPFNNRTRVDYQAIGVIFDKLFTYDDELVPQGELVEDWEDPDESTWILHLREGVTFHDGTPWNADAAVFNLEQLRESDQGASQLERVSDVTAVDDTTVEIALSAPFPTLPITLSQSFTAMVSPTAFEEMGPEEFARSPVGTGPFRFVSWDPSADLMVEANPDYWDTDDVGESLPYVDGVEFRTLPDAEASVLALQAGDVDVVIVVPLSSVELLASDPDTQIVSVPTQGWQYLFLNNEQEPFSDVDKRRAVQLAIDRQAIIDTVMFGTSTPALSPLAPGSWAYDPTVQSEGAYGPTADVEGALAALDAAGTPDGFEFDLICPSQDPFAAMCQAIKSQLAAVGIMANLDVRDISGVLDDMFASNFSALAINWRGAEDPDLQITPFFATEGGNNFGNYSNPEVDELLQEAGSVADREQRADLYHQAQEIIQDEAALVLIDHPSEIRALRSNVRGWRAIGDQRLYLQPVWLEQ